MLIIFLLLQGCTTGYSSLGAQGGYSETQLDENVFKVYFEGNNATKKTQVDDFNLLRCAELTIQSHYKYFAIANSNSSSKNQLISIPNNNGGQIINNSMLGTTNIIVMYKDKPTNTISFNAELIYKNIKNKYKLK